MSEENSKPLHVQVAEALGCKPIQDRTGLWLCGDSEDGPTCSFGIVGFDRDGWTPYFDTDWAATGPLLERFAIDLNHFGDGDPKDCSEPRSWFARHERKEWGKWDEVEAATPLLAVCELIVSLKKLGELE